jgi:hypothetical protein
MEQVKLLSMTVVLTLLIWASADSLVNETASITVSFTPVPAAAPDMIVTAQPLSDAYELEVSGPRNIVEDLRAQPPREVRLRMTDRPTGATVVRLDRAMIKRELVEQWRESSKLTIASVRPETLPVAIDHWVARDVDIVLKRLTLAYDVEPQLSQATATVRMRESRLQAFPGEEPLQLDISADLERLLRDRPKGERVTIPLNLDARAFGPGAALEPSTVGVTATVKAQRRTAQIPTVPILFAVSFANLEKPYRAVARDGTSLSLVTRTITVTGPTEAVTGLVRGVSRAYGIVQLKEDDLDQLGVLKLVTPEYHLPHGIELAEDPSPIEFKLIDDSVAEADTP